jgi:uncharacterized membrane protein
MNSESPGTLRCFGWRSESAPKYHAQGRVIIVHRFGVAVFHDEKAASNGSCALKELIEHGTTIDTFVVVKSADGIISVLDRSGGDSHATAIAAMIGGLAGLPAGPLAAAMGAAGGALIGFSAEMTDRGADARFLNKISHELAPGKAAIFAGLDDHNFPLFDATMKESGGTVIRPDIVDGTFLVGS